MLRLVTYILALVAIQARVFNNPVIGDKSCRDPAAIMVNGTYYVVTVTDGLVIPLNFEIYQSTDLINWKTAGYIFNESNYPLWSNPATAFGGAKIHENRGYYHLYYTAVNKADGNFAVGVAIAPHPLGPYTAIDRPLLTETGSTPSFPTLANDNGILYLIWSSANIIKARQLNSDGLGFASDAFVVLLSAYLDWEQALVKAPWYFRKGIYHYIMYTGSAQYCDGPAIGVARSKNALGPYEKLDKPILVSNNYIRNPNFNSMVPDPDGFSDVIVFKSYRASVGCNNGTVISMASVGWSADGWPYIFDY